MGVQHFRLPDPGEGLTEAEIVDWKVAEGDAVTVNQIVVEIETAKSLVELPIPWAGTVAELLVPVGATVAVGTPIIAVDVPGMEPTVPSGGGGAATMPLPSGPPAGGGAAGEAPAGGGAAGGAGQAAQTFLLPDPGEGLTEAEIVSWKVAAGDAVTVNQIVVEIETAKSLVELPIPWAGTVAELLVPVGTTVAVGTPIITIAVAGGAPAGGGAAAPAREPNLVGYGAIAGSTTRRARKSAVPAPAASSAAAPAGAAPASAPPLPSSPPSGIEPAPEHGLDATTSAPPDGARPLAKPPVRKYAKDRGVDLRQVTGTGPNGVITRADVDAALAGAPAPGAGQQDGAAQPVAGGVPTSTRSGERETRVPIKGVRKMTAAAMVSSAFTAPHVTEFVTVDVTATMELVERLKADREFRDLKVTPLLVVAKALLLACRRNPGVNAAWDEAAGEIVLKNYVNLGIAAATPRGLVVPNIKDADAMTMAELAGALGDLVDTARAGRTQPADMSGGTITITNVGVFGVDTGTPIINPGESAILAFGAVRRTPWVVTGADGAETIVPRWVTQLALSFDHRLIDGDLGSRFLADLAAILADPARGLVWG